MSSAEVLAKWRTNNSNLETIEAALSIVTDFVGLKHGRRRIVCRASTLMSNQCLKQIAIWTLIDEMGAAGIHKACCGNLGIPSWILCSWHSEKIAAIRCPSSKTGRSHWSDQREYLHDFYLYLSWLLRRGGHIVSAVPKGRHCKETHTNRKTWRKIFEVFPIK